MDYAMMVIDLDANHFYALVYIPNITDVMTFEVNFDELLGLIDTFEIKASTII